MLSPLIAVLAACSHETVIFNIENESEDSLCHIYTGLPIAYINTENNQDVAEKDLYLKGHFVLYDKDKQELATSSLKIKGHGNSTWTCDKKPYKLKFNESVSLFDFPKDTEWTLLANYADPTFLRNDVTLWMARNYGNFEWVPRAEFLNLVLNGSYIGLYQLTEQVKVSRDRIDVGKSGFLLEVDGKHDEHDVTFSVPHILNPINIKAPLVVEGDESYTFVYDYLQKTDAALFSQDWLDPEVGYKNLVDIASFAEWYLVMEMTSNGDAIYYTSCFMNLVRNGKLKMSPVWDFDLSCGNYPQLGHGANEREKFYIKGQVQWLDRMMQDPEFVALVKQRLDVYCANKQALLDYIQDRATQIQTAVWVDNVTWGALCSDTFPQEVVIKMHQNEVKKLCDWFDVRLDWLKAQFEAM